MLTIRRKIISSDLFVEAIERTNRDKWSNFYRHLEIDGMRLHSPVVRIIPIERTDNKAITNEIICP